MGKCGVLNLNIEILSDIFEIYSGGATMFISGRDLL
jgi:hypothetical protein